MLARTLRTCVPMLAIAACGADDSPAIDATDASSSAATSIGDPTSTGSTDTATDTAGDEGSTSAAASTAGDPSDSSSSNESSTGAELPDFDDVPWSTGDEI